MAKLTNKTVLDMANTISQAVIGENALSDGTRPSKDTLIGMINDRQRDIAAIHDDWTWLNAKTAVAAYDVTGSATVVPNITATGISTTLVDDPPGQQLDSYIASQLVLTAPTKFTSVNIPTIIDLQGGVGDPYNMLQALVCPIVNGLPDIAHPLVSSLPLNPNRPNDATLTNNTLTFNGEILDAGTYMMVLVVVAFYYNGVAYTVGTITGSTGGFYQNQESGSWVAGETMAYSLTAIVGEYITEELTLTNVWQTIRSIKSNNGQVLLPAVDPHNGTTPPSGYFWIQRVNSDGTITILMTSTDPAPYTWTIDGKMKVLDGEDLTDYNPGLGPDGITPLPIVYISDTLQMPAEYRYLIELGVQLDCIGLNLTINSPVNPQILASRYDKGLSDMEFTYRDAHEDIGIETTVSTGNIIDNSVGALPIVKYPNNRR